jgi:hypothetical protein
MFCYGCNYLNRRLSFKWPFQTDGNAGLLIDGELVLYQAPPISCLCNIIICFAISLFKSRSFSKTVEATSFFNSWKVLFPEISRFRPTELYRPDSKALVEYSTLSLSKPNSFCVFVTK